MSFNTDPIQDKLNQYQDALRQQGAALSANYRQPSLNETRVGKIDLLKILNENRVKHINEYTEAISDYWLALEKYYTQGLELARAKKTSDDHFQFQHPQKPISQETQYNRVIRQLELSLDATVTLDAQQFSTYVMDDWAWKASFSANSMMLKSYK